MNTFYEYQKRQLAEKLKRRVVVWYDADRDFEPFISELLGQKITSLLPGTVAFFSIDGSSVPISFVAFAESYFETRLAVEKFVCGSQPEPLLVYVPGRSRQRASSLLMELEMGGECYEPSLKRQARNALKEKGFDDGHIDELLKSENVAYHDIVQFIEHSSATNVQPSMLPVIFGVSQNDKIIAAWLATPGKDGEVSLKSADVGLYKLIEARMGISLGTLPLEEARSKVCRSLLVAEFSADLQCEPPQSITMIEIPQELDKVTFMQMVTKNLRNDYPGDYIRIADVVQSDLSLDSSNIAAESLGSIDTFRFEEQVLLRHCDRLIVESEYTEALRIEHVHGSSFWVAQQVERKAQWRACRMMAELGALIQAVSDNLKSTSSKPEKWVENYTKEGGWFLIDQLHRQVEALVAKLDEEPELYQALTSIEHAYDAVIQRMATGFTKALEGAQWQVSGITLQTEIYEKAVLSSTDSVAYFWVDALRYEMGDELARQLEGTGEVILRPALAALPSITKVGMAALLPGASASFDVVADKKNLAVRIDGSMLAALLDRRKLLKARQPQMVELELDELLQMASKKLHERVTAAPLIIVRSQEIDSLGEGTSDFLARQVMDTVIGNVARAVRKLAAVGIEHFVIAADHGHLFSREKGEDMKTDSPGGKTVELHRRCWIGQGGAIDLGVVKVSGNELGYDSSLDFIFPSGSGVFRAGGSLSYHHGGTSLQEMVIPLLTILAPQTKTKQTSAKSVIVSGVPAILATRTMGITIEVGSSNLMDIIETGPITVRPILVSGGKQVGRAGMAVHGEFDGATGCVTIKQNEKVMVGMLLSEEPEKLQVVILDPQTDAVLGQSDEIKVKLGM